MSEIRTFDLENRTKFSSDCRHLDFRHLGHSVCLIVRFVWSFGHTTNVQNPNVRLVELINQMSEIQTKMFGSDTVWNPNWLGMGQLWKVPKTEILDFRCLLLQTRQVWFGCQTVQFSEKRLKSEQFSSDLRGSIINYNQTKRYNFGQFHYARPLYIHQNLWPPL